MARTKPKTTKPKKPKQVTRYTHDAVTDPATPETGHTSLIVEEQLITVPMDSGWSSAIHVGKLPEEDLPVVVDMDPAVDPILFWAGKRNKREVALLPLQRNEVVAESRIARIIDRAREAASAAQPQQESFAFADLEKNLRESGKDKRVEFYIHDEGWKNKLICGDSLEVMESVLHYEGLRGKVQMIYIDPPYGIKYDSNFQQRIDSTKNNERDKADDVLTIKAFRDTWTLGIHSYLSYLEERLYLCRELLAETGSVFIQINDENIHLVRHLLDEVFGRSNFLAQINFQKTGSQEASRPVATVDYLIWYAKSASSVKYYPIYKQREVGDLSLDRYDHVEFGDGTSRRLSAAEIRGEEPVPIGRRFRRTSLLSEGETSSSQEFLFQGKLYRPRAGNHWKTTIDGLGELARKGRILVEGSTITYKRYADDFDYVTINDRWESMQIGRVRDYAVQTADSVVQRCMLMSTSPGDLVLDPTCGSGTTAFVAEKIGRRWLTCDTSRVAINVARKRLLSGVLEHYKTREGSPSSGFIYKTVGRVRLKSLAHDLESEKVELIDQPEVDKDAIRVCGPFEVMTLGRYSIEDWKGYLVATNGESGKLENYISVICRLYRKEAVLQESAGVIHAVIDSENGMLGLSVGPISGRVTARQIHDAVLEAAASGIGEVHVLGWAFEANVGEVRTKIGTDHKVSVELVMIRPDTLAEGLKIIQPEMLFSPLALPDIGIASNKDGQFTVTLKGVAVFDRKSRVSGYKRADSGYVSAWYLDEDYDGDCFVDCQMFFDFKKKPAIEKTLRIDVEQKEWTLRTSSDPFTPGQYARLAVKVVDVFGNESTEVRDLS